MTIRHVFSNPVADGAATTDAESDADGLLAGVDAAAAGGVTPSG